MHGEFQQPAGESSDVVHLLFVLLFIKLGSTHNVSGKLTEPFILECLTKAPFSLMVAGPHTHQRTIDQSGSIGPEDLSADAAPNLP